ncbi:hypothetical protein E2320_020308 [Naja naja]|nr:hypothetical protein E2320_020308 [Naja naja]
MLAPQTVKAVSWEELQEVLGNHYAPKPSRIARRHVFRQRAQAENESISEYVAALGSAALHCGFHDQLDDMLLDQLVCGVRDLATKALLAKADLTLKQGIEEAQAAELSSVSAAAIQKANNLPGSKPSTAVNYEDAAYEDEFFEEEEEHRHKELPLIEFYYKGSTSLCLRLMILETNKICQVPLRDKVDSQQALTYHKALNV